MTGNGLMHEAIDKGHALIFKGLDIEVLPKHKYAINVKNKGKGAVIDLACRVYVDDAKSAFIDSCRLSYAQDKKNKRSTKERTTSKK